MASIDLTFESDPLHYNSAADMHMRLSSCNKTPWKTQITLAPIQAQNKSIKTACDPISLSSTLHHKISSLVTVKLLHQQMHQQIDIELQRPMFAVVFG